MDALGDGKAAVGVLVGTGEADKRVEIDGEVCETAELVKAALELLPVCATVLDEPS